VALPASIGRPAEAARPSPPGGIATIDSVSGCAFTVTYTWSGFSGAKAFIATINLWESGDAFSIPFSAANSGIVSGKSGSFTAVINLGPAVGASRSIHAHGSLSKNGTAVSGSFSPHSNAVSTTCTNPSR